MTPEQQLEKTIDTYQINSGDYYLVEKALQDFERLKELARKTNKLLPPDAHPDDIQEMADWCDEMDLLCKESEAPNEEF